MSTKRTSPLPSANSTTAVFACGAAHPCGKPRGDGFEATEEEGFDTVGGFVLGRLNRMPAVGDEVEVDSGLLRVTQMSRRRIKYLLFVASNPPRFVD